MSTTTRADVSRLAAAAFRPSEQVRIGAEVEWLVFCRADPSMVVTAQKAAAVAAGPLPCGGSTSIEPGGQVELITRPKSSPAELIAAIESDAQVRCDRFATHDLALVPLGLDPVRPATRTPDEPRYIAMERYFAVRSPAGVDMMTRTASLQLNIDFGPHPHSTWQLAHDLGPLLATTFANSPTIDGATFAPMSHRMQIWESTDPSRSRPVGREPDDWYRYVCGAQVMLRHGLTHIEPVFEPRTFAQWLADDRPPTPADLDLHLSTLFPPLRPRGYLELRMIDALPSEGRAAAISTVWTLLTDTSIRDEVARICLTPAMPSDGATSEGLGDPAIRGAADNLLALVGDRHRRTNPILARACDRWRARIGQGPPLRTLKRCSGSPRVDGAVQREQAGGAITPGQTCSRLARMTSTDSARSSTCSRRLPRSLARPLAPGQARGQPRLRPANRIGGLPLIDGARHIRDDLSLIAEEIEEEQAEHACGQPAAELPTVHQRQSSTGKEQP